MQIATSGGTASWYSHYEQLYQITLNKNNGSGGTSTFYTNFDGDNYTDTYGTTRLTNDTVSVPSRSGYIFNGYWTSANGGDRYINASGRITETFSSNTTLYAHWTPIYTITLDILALWHLMIRGRHLGRQTHQRVVPDIN